MTTIDFLVVQEGMQSPKTEAGVFSTYLRQGVQERGMAGRRDRQSGVKAVTDVQASGQTVAMPAFL